MQRLHRLATILNQQVFTQEDPLSPLEVEGLTDCIVAKTRNARLDGVKILRDGLKVVFCYRGVSYGAQTLPSLYKVTVNGPEAQESWEFAVPGHLNHLYAPHRHSVENPGFYVSYGPKPEEILAITMMLGPVSLFYNFRTAETVSKPGNVAHRKLGYVDGVTKQEEAQRMACGYPYTICRWEGPITLGPHVFQQCFDPQSIERRIEEVAKLDEVYTAFGV